MKRAASSLLAAVFALPLCMSAQSVYLDPSQPIDKRVDDLIHQLTPAEKTSLLSTTAPAIDRLKSSSDEWLEPEPARNCMDATDDDVPGVDQHGSNLGSTIGS